MPGANAASWASTRPAGWAERMARPELTFAYIVEPPDYEILACTLLASIRSHFDPGQVAAIGYCPAHLMDDLHPAVLKAHAMMGAEIRPMVTEGMWDSPYPHGNKIIAAMQPRDSRFSAFVDSDVLFLRDNSPGTLARTDHVSCSMAASMTWAGQEIWEPIYGALGMKVPPERMHLMRRSAEPVAPYFSAGLVVFPEKGGTAGRFGDIWYDTARRIDRIERLEHRRPYLDQMSLPAAILRAGLRWNVLPEEQHYILGGKLRGQPFPRDRGISTVHYRKLQILREVGLHKIARGMLQDQIGVPFVRRLVPEGGEGAPDTVRDGTA
ncbi:hypothetical protein [Profundibacterium mesophilum]|uniref:Uncharacterized protein n=1 Tax=Profundibacterium mesophilum KAUST100406-0324 TaxID=1037889 RepID=A0A921NS06_9RHOB|nr:hypothetical protein [Profundibacterium mesophilum]KAF0676805.1 hypothetical protein PMES_00892 [Profundibacterium mesophilum KAUST100406-0324]